MAGILEQENTEQQSNGDITPTGSPGAAALHNQVFLADVAAGTKTENCHEATPTQSAWQQSRPSSSCVACFHIPATSFHLAKRSLGKRGHQMHEEKGEDDDNMKRQGRKGKGKFEEIKKEDGNGRRGGNDLGKRRLVSCHLKLKGIVGITEEKRLRDEGEKGTVERKEEEGRRRRGKGWEEESRGRGQGVGVGSSRIRFAVYRLIPPGWLKPCEK
ncbi:hypothetical protein EYF80_027623 [Liparis tanakae]|uniref:Uncharacterized protein n=1 Tax=Liparis tanakae TaxID=230148 RepID=A0A4Z2HAU9_9TELE|nr:hypothetical protein EYF80_027623 [Liparis tanakae]